jgi:hypothetical protein
MATEKENIKFIRVLDDADVISAGATTQLNTDSLKADFGYNYNTILIFNGADEEIILYLDRQEIAYIPGGANAQFSLDWEDGIYFTSVALKNNDGSNDTSANEIRVSVGRTGK